jgi:hypothetical protein
MQHARRMPELVDARGVKFRAVAAAAHDSSAAWHVAAGPGGPSPAIGTVSRVRCAEEYENVIGWIRRGVTDSEISRLTSIPRETIRDWRLKGEPGAEAWSHSLSDCPICGNPDLDEVAYCYLLGLYLGDGTIVRFKRDVYCLRISLDRRYPGIIDECAAAMAAVRSRGAMKVGKVQRKGCTVVHAYWKHWPCAFPQHGAGRKHVRRIALAPWQRDIVEKHPERLLRGLIHSDGSRSANRVAGKVYPRYEFSNASQEILDIFCSTLDRFGARWRRMNGRMISVAKRADVDRLDLVIGPKT